MTRRNERIKREWMSEGPFMFIRMEKGDSWKKPRPLKSGAISDKEERNFPPWKYDYE